MKPRYTPLTPVTIDFETHGIEARPHYPPTPVGVSIKYHNKPPHYYAFDHLSDNNCTRQEAIEALKVAYTNPSGVLFHNAKFDLDVANAHLGLPIPSWQVVHDTMILLFLDDPHQDELGLKKSASRLLGKPPEEQDVLADWLIENPPLDVSISKSKGSSNYYGRYIANAPSWVVSNYANGDVVRTEELFTLLHQKIIERGMSEAYDRERKLMFILLEMERQGVAIDVNRLSNDVNNYGNWLTNLNTWIIETLGADKDINLDSSDQLLKAMVQAKKVNVSLLPLTATGKPQTTKESLLLGVTDTKLLGALTYRSQLITCLNTFMKPWLATATISGGVIYTTWHQIKIEKDGNAIGTRTGRLSSTPNFQNIPKKFKDTFLNVEKPFEELPPLPSVRSYIIPFKDEVFIDRDFSQQELRILAHFDGGSLQEVYNKDPWVDFHDYAKNELSKIGKTYDRKAVKNTNLGLIYGMGVSKLAVSNGMTESEAADLKKAILTLYPGLKSMYDVMRQRAIKNMPIKTWGGRRYYCEPSQYKDGKVISYDYKMVNLLVQGSAADCTKEALIRYHAIKHPSAKIVFNIHDQITVSIPKRFMHREMEVLRDAMESIEFDVKMLTEGSYSFSNLEELKDYDKRDEILYSG